MPYLAPGRSARWPLGGAEYSCAHERAAPAAYVLLVLAINRAFEAYIIAHGGVARFGPAARTASGGRSSAATAESRSPCCIRWCTSPCESGNGDCWRGIGKLAGVCT